MEVETSGNAEKVTEQIKNMFLTICKVIICAEDVTFFFFTEAMWFVVALLFAVVAAQVSKNDLFLIVYPTAISVIVV